MTGGPFLVGQTVRVTIRVRAPGSRELADAGDLTVRFLSPADGASLVDVPATHVDLGKYFGRIVPDVDGLWRYRVEGQPPDIAVAEGSFTVEPSAVL